MKFLFPLSIIFSTTLVASESEDLSKSMGHMIQENLEELGIDLDFDLIIEGMKEAKEGKHSPYNEEKLMSVLSELQEKQWLQEEKKNLAEAESFLTKNQNSPSIISLEDGEIQYTILHSGKGEILKTYHRPSMKYVLKYLDGTTVAHSEEEEVVDLDEVIPGFKRGVLGMKEGEKRKLFLHPKWSQQERLLRPNALLIIEVELIQLNPTPYKELPEEISSPLF